MMKKLLWLDLEMTGLDVETEVIIEAGAIVTDLNLKPSGEYHAIVKQPDSYLKNMDDWNQKHHKESGLLEAIPHGKSPITVERELIEFVNQYFDRQEDVVLAGNSISQDRLFIDKYFKSFSDRLHYRMLDVTSWKLMFKFKHNLEYQKKNCHRAIDDIKESIAELDYYMGFIQIEDQ